MKLWVNSFFLFLLYDWVLVWFWVEMATHPSTLAWKIPWTGEHCRLQSMGSQRVGHDWATSLVTYLSESKVSYLEVKWKSEVKFSQSWPTLCDPMDYTVHGILQARILEWVVFPSFRGSSQPRNWTQVSHIAHRFFTSWATRETLILWKWLC